MKVSKHIDADAVIKDEGIAISKIKDFPPLRKGSASGSVQSDCSFASGVLSHAEGFSTYAKGYASHSEGSHTSAESDDSHSEGYASHARSFSAHAEGHYANANAPGSHAEGWHTETLNSGEHAEGEYNLSLIGKTIHTVGIGSHGYIDDKTEITVRKNAHEIHKDGKHYIFGIGGYDGKNSEEKGTKTLQEVVANTVDLDSEQTITALKKFNVAPVMQAGLSMANTRIRNVNTPTNDTDAATKKYVDDLITSLSETVALLEQQNSALESRISELENIISQITIKEE